MVDTLIVKNFPNKQHPQWFETHIALRQIADPIHYLIDVIDRTSNIFLISGVEDGIMVMGPAPILLECMLEHNGAEFVTLESISKSSIRDFEDIDVITHGSQVIIDGRNQQTICISIDEYNEIRDSVIEKYRNEVYSDSTIYLPEDNETPIYINQSTTQPRTESDIIPSDYKWIKDLGGGRYKYLDRIAHNVCKARDLNGEIVAIKKFKYAGPDSFPTYDIQGADNVFLPVLSHGHIAEFVRGHIDGGIFTVSRFVNGETLLKAFFNSRANLDEGLTILLQLTNTVAFLHRRNIIHRDITPKNVLWDGVKITLLDFGAAAYFNHLDPPKSIQMTFFENDYSLDVLNFWTRPPEIYQCEATFPATDVYYLGILGCFLFSGYLLIEDKFSGHDLENGLFEEIEIPNDLCKILQKAISEEFEYRYRDASEMFRALQKINPKV